MIMVMNEILQMKQDDISIVLKGKTDERGFLLPFLLGLAEVFFSFGSDKDFYCYLLMLVR